MELMSIILSSPFVSSDDIKFLTSTISLLDPKISPIIKELPMPDPSSISLINSFLSFVVSNDSHNFINKIQNANSQSIISLLFFVLRSTRKIKSPMSDTSIDYSAIDFLCHGFSQCSLKPILEATTTKAIQSIAKKIILIHPLGSFRLLYGLLNVLYFQTDEKIIKFISFFGPKQFPSFSCCWIQLVMHKSVFPRLSKNTNYKSIQFCVSFINICISLCVKAPYIFYKPVTRIFYTIASSIPMFFAINQVLIYENLPINFIQFRNIIQSVEINSTLNDLPPIGFDFEKQIKFFGIDSLMNNLSNIDSNDLNNIIELLNNSNSSKNYIPKIYWCFVIYSFTHFNNDVQEMFISIFNKANNEKTLKFLLIAIVDQIRFQNLHTIAAKQVIFNLFKVSNLKIKEMILLELIRRLLCVTQPNSIKHMFKDLINAYKEELNEIFSKCKHKTFEKIRQFMEKIIEKL